MASPYMYSTVFIRFPKTVNGADFENAEFYIKIENDLRADRYSYGPGFPYGSPHNNYGNETDVSFDNYKGPFKDGYNANSTNEILIRRSFSSFILDKDPSTKDVYHIHIKVTTADIVPQVFEYDVWVNLKNADEGYRERSIDPVDTNYANPVCPGGTPPFPVLFYYNVDYLI